MGIGITTQGVVVEVLVRVLDRSGGFGYQTRTAGTESMG